MLKVRAQDNSLGEYSYFEIKELSKGVIYERTEPFLDGESKLESDIRTYYTIIGYLKGSTPTKENLCCKVLGEYKTKEGALRVIDEIENRVIKISVLLAKEGNASSRGQLLREFLIYHMPRPIGFE